ncbi:MAG: Fic family protein [Nanoarchaeota archaeon]|nr:Fic family protein [Nanoarchaeota archaeon]MBU1623308.1 Fic family protein [Nanoarchaeota archaeon]MBU1974556.1 Fic family protein [Nanoarchaeota archaeon]
MYTLTKKDIIAFNQEAGEEGKFNNESSLDFALSLAKTKKNWLYELSYLSRSLLVDHVFRDGNKRTCLLTIVYYLEKNNKKYDRERLLMLIKKIAKNNITNPLMIMRMIYNVTQEGNKTTSRKE